MVNLSIQLKVWKQILFKNQNGAQFSENDQCLFR